MSICDIPYWGKIFQTTPSLSHLPKVRTVVFEKNSDPNYVHTGKERKGLRYCFFQYTLSGCGEFHARGKTYKISPGKGFLCDSHDPAYQYNQLRNANEPWVFFYIQMLGESTHLMVNNIVSNFGYIYDLDLNHRLVQKYIEYSKSDFDGVLTAAQSSRGVNELIESLLESKQSGADEVANDSIVTEALSILSSITDENWNASLLADKLNISREHLSRLFNQHLGQTPYQYIREFRINRACYSLKNSNKNIKEVAYEHGFSSAESFSKSFKQVMKISPVEYKNSVSWFNK
jgi:AraC-like DNA-binding protein